MRKPRELRAVRVLATPEEIGLVRGNFLTIARYRLEHLYTDGGTSAPYEFECVEKFLDAVCVVLYYRSSSGGIMVGLHHGLRPSLELPLRRDRERSLTFPILKELVAGGVTPKDYSTVGVDGVAAHEIEEEAGFVVDPTQLVPLGESTFSAPGFAVEKLHFYCAEVNPQLQAEAQGDGSPLEEVQDFTFIELYDAVSKCRTGVIPDQKTEVGLLRFASWMGVIPRFGIGDKP